MIKSMIVAAAMLLGAMAAGLSPCGGADGAEAGAGPAVVITEAGARDSLTVAAGAGLHVEAGLEVGGAHSEGGTGGGAGPRSGAAAGHGG